MLEVNRLCDSVYLSRSLDEIFGYCAVKLDIKIRGENEKEKNQINRTNVTD